MTQMLQQITSITTTTPTRQSILPLRLFAVDADQNQEDFSVWLPGTDPGLTSIKPLCPGLDEIRQVRVWRFQTVKMRELRFLLPQMQPETSTIPTRLSN